jgi:putative FmdB family regulatory protein
MPTYDYKCKNCSHVFEHFQSMKDAPLRKCPKCGKIALERLIGTGAAVLFKGSGFYQTDYRSESYKAAHKADSNAGKPSESSGGGSGGNDGSGGGKGETKSDGSKKSEAAPAKSESPKPTESKPKFDKPSSHKKHK